MIKEQPLVKVEKLRNIDCLKSKIFYETLVGDQLSWEVFKVWEVQEISLGDPRILRIQS